MTKSNRVEIIAFGCDNEFGSIINQRKHEAPAPGYKMVKFDIGGGKMWIHESRLNPIEAKCRH